MKFEWDGAKALANERKHGVSFDEARTVFGDVHALHEYDGPHSSHEERFIIIGVSEVRRVLTVVYVESRNVPADQRACRNAPRETNL